MFNLLALFLSVFLTSTPQTKANSRPLVSATDPSYLSCTVWNGRAWTPVTARSAQTSTVTSPKGFRAYAEVQVVVGKDGSCGNTTELFVAAPGEDNFKLVFSKTPSESDGNGIRLLGWSPDGTKLLAELNLWKYESDGCCGHIALVYDASKNAAAELPSLYDPLTKYFGKNCDFDFALNGWKSDDQIVLRVTKSLEDPAYEQHFCVERPRLLVFDLTSRTLKSSLPK